MALRCGAAGWALLGTWFGTGTGATAAQRRSLAAAEPLEGSRASDVGILLRGKTSL